MNLLIVGSGHGSWGMRGVQLGAALGARVMSTPTPADFDWATLAILVKRAGAVYAPECHRRNLPIVWDAIDFWRQPSENDITEAHAKRLLTNQLQQIRPVLTIGATKAQADACGGVYLPHHSWAGLVPTPAREAVQVVAYQGNAFYLGRWAEWIGAECRARGWRFVVNPPDLSQADIIVAFRDGQWDGWICREWKSGVKVVNAIAAGRPLISQHSAARRELQAAGSIVESQSQLGPAFDAWESYQARESAVSASMALAPQYRLDAVAAAYRTILTERGRAWAA